ncbi:MAG: FtsW/RodA/SpoVE family cell cycle protein [Oscillospiraceae bacterium]|jgi:cell division protein FtsW (lipid II flippase)|nr:FtsW/RodA/SpoVE family cell cycle protein [Oscillospiraceae bacterium]
MPRRLFRHKSTKKNLLLWGLVFAVLFVATGLLCARYGAWEYYTRSFAPVLLCVCVFAVVAATQRSGGLRPLQKAEGQLLLMIPVLLLVFGAAAQAVWTRSWVEHCVLYPSKWPIPADRQDTWVIFGAFALAGVASLALAAAVLKGRIQQKSIWLIAFLGFAMAGAWIPLVVNIPAVYDINKITYVIGLSILLNLPKLMEKEKTKLWLCVGYTLMFMTPLVLKTESEFGSLIITGVAFFVMLITYFRSRKRVLLFFGIAAVALVLLVFGVARNKFEKRFDEWLQFVPLAQNGDVRQTYSGMLGVLLGGRRGGDPRYLIYIPVGDNDMIGAVLIQLFGSLVVLLLMILPIALLVFMGYRRAMKETDHLQRGIAFGFTTTLCVQSLLMWAGNLALLPLSGNVQPFLSSGGGALCASFFMVDVLFLLYRKQYRKEYLEGRRGK